MKTTTKSRSQKKREKMKLKYYGMIYISIMMLLTASHTTFTLVRIISVWPFIAAPNFSFFPSTLFSYRHLKHTHTVCSAAARIHNQMKSVSLLFFRFGMKKIRVSCTQIMCRAPESEKCNCVVYLVSFL